MAVRTISKPTFEVKEAEIAVPEVRTGAAAAALYAAGIGSAVYGLSVTLAEVIPAVKSALNLYNPVGPLSGKTTAGVLAWLLSWVMLAGLYRGKNPAIERVFAITMALVFLGFALTFPPLFQALAGE